MRISGYNYHDIGKMAAGACMFQSPKMRISGYNFLRDPLSRPSYAFQSPKMRISGYNKLQKARDSWNKQCFSPRKWGLAVTTLVSIAIDRPDFRFSPRKWGLAVTTGPDGKPGPDGKSFQSPKMRISGYNLGLQVAKSSNNFLFQSPKMRISGYNITCGAIATATNGFQSPKMRISGYNLSCRIR